MKKFWMTAGVLTVFLGSTLLHKPFSLNAEPEDLNYEKINQEAERNRELLEIWKDHVKTLTKERDQAYQELERMKAGGAGAGVAQFGGMETAALPPSPQMTQQIDSLQSEVARLQTELQSKAPSQGSGSNRELQMQFSALQSQSQQSKKELIEARNDKERALQEKEKALSQIEKLNGEIEGLRANKTAAAPEIQPGDDVSKSLQKAYDIQKKRLEDLQLRYRERELEIEDLDKRLQASPSQSSGDLAALQNDNATLQSENARLRSDLGQKITAAPGPADNNAEVFVRKARELQYENDSLKAQIEKLQVVEKELANTRAYFTPMVKELQEKSDGVSAENASLTAEVQKARAEASQLSQNTAAMSEQNQQLSGQVEALKKEQESMASQIENYKAQVQMATADKEELKKAQAQFQELQKSISGYEESIASKDAQIKQFGSQLAALEKSNREIESRETDNLKSVEKYQTALRANLTDMKNLKSNFEAYLESLVASFDERQR